MSGYTDDDIVRRGILTDDAGFVEKPFSASALAAAVRRELDKRREARVGTP
jgi:FixJ family two-component response regulator